MQNKNQKPHPNHQLVRMGFLSAPFIMQVDEAFSLIKINLLLTKLLNLGKGTVDIFGSEPTKHIVGYGRGIAHITSGIQYSEFPKTEVRTIATAKATAEAATGKQFPTNDRCAVSVRERVEERPAGSSTMGIDFLQTVEVGELDDFSHQVGGTDRLEHVLSHVTFLPFLPCRPLRCDVEIYQTAKPSNVSTQSGLQINCVTTWYCRNFPLSYN